MNLINNILFFNYGYNLIKMLDAYKDEPKPEYEP